jgi:palmitoyltransferase
MHSTEPQSIDFSHNSPLTESRQKASEKHSEPKEIEDENSGPISISALGKNPMINDSDEEQEAGDRVSVEVQQPVEESVIQIETRFCTKCSIEQPLRAKHCKYCDVCIALYDHHCPWMGNCIGERNKFCFWWYLLFECLTINFTLALLAFCVSPAHGFFESLQKNWAVFIAISLAGIFDVFVSFLLGFHCFLILKNKTTWEQLSWNHISYLNKWPKHLGSPFSAGVFKNLHHFCCKPLPKGYTLWIFPSKVPS